MKEVDDRIAYADGYRSCIADLLEFVKEKTNGGTTPYIMVMDIVEEFIGNRIDQNTKRYSEIASLIESATA